MLVRIFDGYLAMYTPAHPVAVAYRMDVRGVCHKWLLCTPGFVGDLRVVCALVIYGERHTRHAPGIPAAGITRRLEHDAAQLGQLEHHAGSHLALRKLLPDVLLHPQCLPSTDQTF